MRTDKIYFYISLIVLYSVWLPSKSISYLIPLASIVLYIGWTRQRRPLKYLFFYFGFFILSSLIHSFLAAEFVWANVLLAIITYSSVPFLFIIRPRQNKVKDIYFDLVPHAQFMLFFQSILGLLQACYGAFLLGRFDLDTGDFVEGTIHPALISERAFSNPMFAVNLFFLMLFLIPTLKWGDRKSKIILLIGGFTLIMASVVHLLMFIFVAVIIAFIIIDYQKLMRGKYVKYASVIISIPLLLLITQPKNFTIVGEKIVKIISGNLPKVTVTLRSVSSVPAQYPYMPIIGLGPGQFTSRASLIGTGRYLGDNFNNPSSPLPFANPQMSEPFQEYVLDLWKLSRQEMYGGGSTAKPYYSWLAIYTEFGLIIVIAGLLALYKLYQKLKILRRDKERQLFLYLLIIGSLVLLFLGLQENYWEIPQSILWGIITLILFYNILRGEYKLLLYKNEGNTST